MLILFANRENGAAWRCGGRKRRANELLRIGDKNVSVVIEERRRGWDVWRNAN
jgi:hypothetical protein